MNEHCSMHSADSVQKEYMAHVWTNGDLSKLVLIDCWIDLNYNKRLSFCEPNSGNKYKWDAFIKGLEWKEGEELCKKVTNEFF